MSIESDLLLAFREAECVKPARHDRAAESELANQNKSPTQSRDISSESDLLLAIHEA